MLEAAAISAYPGGTTPRTPEPSAGRSAGSGGRLGRRGRSGSGPARRVRIALAQERRPPGFLPQRAGAADQRLGGGVRAGIVHYNDEAEVDRLLTAVAELASGSVR